MTAIDDLMRYARLARFGDTASTTELRAALELFAAEQREAGALAERERCARSDADEFSPTMIVGHSEARGGWCVFEQVSHGEYELRRGPFASKDEADTELSTQERT